MLRMHRLLMIEVHDIKTDLVGALQDIWESKLSAIYYVCTNSTSDKDNVMGLDTMIFLPHFDIAQSQPNFRPLEGPITPQLRVLGSWHAGDLTISFSFAFLLSPIFFYLPLFNCLETSAWRSLLLLIN